jgi:basic amino acid/polyamine antiporter, APA family
VSEPERRLGFVAATAIVVANMIGTGVFTSTGFQAESLHDPTTILIAWVVGGVLALCGAAAYAELGAMMPRAGGEYVYLREAYHPVVGVMSGWASLIAGFSAPIAGSAKAFSAYLGASLPALRGEVAQDVVAIALVLAMTGLHAFDTVIGGRVQTAFTITKTLLIMAFIAAGLTIGTGDWSHFATRGGGTANLWTPAFVTALMFVSFAYSGWNAAAYIAGDIRDPVRNVPRALLVGTGLVMALYVLLNVVFLYAVPPAILAGEATPGFDPVVEVGDVAGRSLFGDSAGRVLSTMIAVALISTVSAMVMAGPRVYAAMAEDHALPAVLARRSRRGVPFVAVMAQGVLSSVIVLKADLGDIINYVSFTLWIFAALTVGAVFILRVRRPDAPRPYRTFGFPVTPALFIALSVWVAYAQLTSNLHKSLYVLATLVLGAVGYLVAARRPGAS